MNTMNTIGKKEPVVGIGASITAILYAFYAILRASGVGVTDEMTIVSMPSSWRSARFRRCQAF